VSTGHDIELEFAFERSRFGVPPSETNRPDAETMVRAATPRVYRRLHDHETSFADLTELRLDLAPSSSVSVTGARQDRYALRLWVGASGETEDEARRVTAEIELIRSHGTFVLNTPRGPNPRCGSYDLFWDIVGPADRPVTINAAYSAIDVFGIMAPVRVCNTHGVVSVLGNSGDIDVTATDAGSITWSGRQGRVRLNAELGIDLKVTDQVYDGTLEATAAGPVRVLLPPGFRSGLVVNVGNDDRFVCRADIQSQFTRRTEVDRIVLTCGLDHPALRLTSLERTVVIDNTR